MVVKGKELMNAILTLLQLILELLRSLIQKKQQQETQAAYDNIDRDPAAEFMSKFKASDKSSTSVSDPTKRDGE